MQKATLLPYFITYIIISKRHNIATNVMAKGAKGAPPTKSEMSLPVKAGGGTMQKFSPSPT